MKKMTKRTLAFAMSAGMLLSNGVWAAETDSDPYGAMSETVTLHVGEVRMRTLPICQVRIL